MSLFLHQLDARHLGAIALAMSGFENARVATRTLRIPRTDLAEQLVRGLTLVNVFDREATRVKRAALGLGDQLFDERTKLFGLRFRRFDRAALDERGREIAQQRETLLARATQLASNLTMPSHPYSSISSGAAA